MIRSAASDRPSIPPFPRPFAATIVALILLLLWDASGLDVALAGLAGTPMGFPLRDNAFLVKVMHEGAKSLSWLLVIGLFVAIRWPIGPLRRLDLRARAQLALTALVSVLAISILKYTSRTSCPWELQAFGGVAHHVSHWAWGVRDGGSGMCFPAGHASAAFAYLGGWFAIRRTAPRMARIWFACALVAGLALGLSQQLRGAHYMSHTLWTGWLCWVTAYAIDAAMEAGARLRERRSAPPPSPKLNES